MATLVGRKARQNPTHPLEEFRNRRTSIRFEFHKPALLRVFLGRASHLGRGRLSIRGHVHICFRIERRAPVGGGAGCSGAPRPSRLVNMPPAGARAAASLRLAWTVRSGHNDGKMWMGEKPCAATRTSLSVQFGRSIAPHRNRHDRPRDGWLPRVSSWRNRARPLPVSFCSRARPRVRIMRDGLATLDWQVPAMPHGFNRPSSADGLLASTPIAAWIAARAVAAGAVVRVLEPERQESYLVPIDQIAVPTEKGTTVVLDDDGIDTDDDFVTQVRLSDRSIRLDCADAIAFDAGG